MKKMKMALALLVLAVAFTTLPQESFASDRDKSPGPLKPYGFVTINDE